MPAPTRDVLAAAISVSHSEEVRLGVPEAAQMDEEGTIQEPTVGEKRLPNSPAGTRSRTRVLKTARRGANVERELQQEGIESQPEGSSLLDGDVFISL